MIRKLHNKTCIYCFEYYLTYDNEKIFCNDDCMYDFRKLEDKLNKKIEQLHLPEVSSSSTRIKGKWIDVTQPRAKGIRSP